MLACGSCNMLLCGLVGGFDSALHASANSFFHSFTQCAQRTVEMKDR
jgi:hypothetical protein